MRDLILLILSPALLAGCATRWQPETSAPLRFTEACPSRRAPAVAEFGESGLKAVYNFVTQDATDAELGALIDGARAAEFSVALATINLNGLDTVFVMGTATLRSQREVDAEFRAACGIGRGHVYLTHVRYNPAQRQSDDVRAR